MTFELDGVTAGYGDLTVLRDLSLRVADGELVVVAGPNGAGKTTTLACAMGTLRPRGGAIRLDGQDIASLPVRERTRLGIALVPEGRSLFPSLTVWENLRVAARAARLPKAQREKGIERAATVFPVVGERMSQPVRSLSGGQQQMVAIGRALLADPRVLLLDEPSIGLAPIVWRQVLQTVRGLADEGRIVVLVEQRVMEALGPADRCAVLRQGRVVRDGPAAGIVDVPELAREYFSVAGEA